jgi:phage tail tape-measure protein
MTTIIAGRFVEQAETSAAADQMVQAGFARTRIASLFVNSAGQHDRFPIGGDQDESPGTEGSGSGAAMGAAGGGAVGAFVGAAFGPAGALAGAATGAYVGSLPGALDSLSEATGDDGGKRKLPLPEVRKAGMMLAVATPNPVAESKALEVLRSAGATDIERSAGTIEGSEWIDFDPVSPVRYVDSSR